MRIAYAAACGLSFLALTGTAAAAPGPSGSPSSPPPLEDYGKLPAFQFPALSPSGEGLAFISVDGEQRKLMAGPVFGPKRAIDTGGAKVRKVRWAGDDHVLVEISQTFNLPFIFRGGHNELAIMLNLDMKSRKTLPIFTGNASIYPAIYGDYGSAEVDGHAYGYFGAISLSRGADEAAQYYLNHSWADLYRVDLSTGQARIAASGSAQAGEWVLNSQGEVVAHSLYDSDSGQWRLMTGPTGGTALASRKSPLDSIDLVGLGRTADTVLVDDGSQGQHVIEEISLKDGKSARLFVTQEPERYAYSAKDKTLIGVGMTGEDGLTFFDPALQARYDTMRRALKARRVTIASYTDDLLHMVVRTDGGTDSGSYWYVDLVNKKIDPIASAYPSVDEKAVGPTSLVHYKAADGLELDGVLTLPPGREAKNLPVVVMPHGGPIGVYDEVRFDWWAQAFASRGYAVFQPNYRGSGGRGLSFQLAGYGEWGRKMQTDVSDGLAALAVQGVVDPRRACIVGASYGGYAAMAGITLQHGLYRCAVSYGGVSDLKAMIGTEAMNVGSGTETTRFWRAAMGADETNLDLISPAKLADRADAPLLLIAGRDDTVVAPDQSTRMADALKRAGKPVELETLTGEDHWLSREDNRISTLKASVAFVEKHNPAG